MKNSFISNYINNYNQFFFLHDGIHTVSCLLYTHLNLCYKIIKTSSSPLIIEAKLDIDCISMYSIAFHSITHDFRIKHIYTQKYTNKVTACYEFCKKIFYPNSLMSLSQ